MDAVKGSPNVGEDPAGPLQASDSTNFQCEPVVYVGGQPAHLVLISLVPFSQRGS